MTKAKIKELRQLGKEDLVVKKQEFQKELMKMNAQIATGTTPKSPGLVRNLKKNIARVNTLLHQPKVSKKA